MMKTCRKCKRELPLDFFNKRGRGDELEARCKQCRNIQKQEYRNNNKEKIKIDSKKYREKHSHSKIKLRGGLDITYRGLHQYIKRNKPKPRYCVICNEKKKLQLASINHTYTRNIKDWLWLCQSCHMLFDKLNMVRICEHT